MSEFLETSSFFGLVITLVVYILVDALHRKFRAPLLNPLLLTIVIVIVFLLIFDIDYESYNSSARYLSYFLTPATVCFAVPLYEKLDLLRRNWKALTIGIISGVVSSTVSVYLMARLFSLDYANYVTFLPKSITTAIAIGVCEELGGYVAITIPVIVVTGIFGNIIAPTACRIFGINDPIARGVAIGSSSHAGGTARAMQMGKTEGAVSSLSIVLSGLLTVVAAPVFAQLY